MATPGGSVEGAQGPAREVVPAGAAGRHERTDARGDEASSNGVIGRMSSRRSLARLCWRDFGCTPQQAISRRMAAEAQRMLRHTSANVVQTSDALGFKDPSYFSRFYFRETGKRPSEEREPISRLIAPG